MLETRHSQIEFLGKDGFQWFIAQVAPDKYWRDKHNQNFENGFRAKIRIMGYHPDDDTIPDNDLPWAHFLCAAQFGSGNMDSGTSFQVQGGEMCVGFFLDGEDGQQPVVIGTFFANYNIDEEGVVDFNTAIAEGTTGLKPLATDTKIIDGDFVKTTPVGGVDKRKKKTGVISTSNNTIKDKDNNDITTVLHYTDQQTYLMTAPDPCENSGDASGKIAKALQELFNALSKLRRTRQGYVDPVLKRLVRIDEIIAKAVKEISSAVSVLIRGARKTLFKGINDKIDTFNDFLNPNFLENSLKAKKLKDEAYCATENIIKGLGNLISKFLKQLLGKLVNVPLCAAEQFLGGLLSAINEQISKLLSPILTAISAFSGSAIPSFESMLTKAMKKVAAALKLLQCEGQVCDRMPDYITNIGSDPKKAVGLDNIIENFSTLANSGLPNIVDNFADLTFPNAGIGTTTGSPAGGSPLNGLVSGCDVRNKKCFPPRIEIFGGGGFGAAADAVVNEIGEVIGVRMIDVGAEYTEKPYVAIIDDCNNGSGARATAVMEDDKVINIIIGDGGSGYLSDGTSDSEGVDVIGEVVGAQVILTGTGYQDGDLVVSESGQTLTPVIEDGRITGVEGIIDQGLDRIPFLEVQSETGFGAELSAITRFVKREAYTDPVVPQAKIITVISCPRFY